MSRVFEIYGQDQTKSYVDSDLPLVIGADDGAHILLPSGPDIAAFLGESRGHLFLQPADGAGSDNPTYHNDTQLEASVWLKSGDVSRIGDLIINWHIAGERLEARLFYGQQRVLVPPAAHHASHGTDRVSKKEIPRVAAASSRAMPRRLRYLITSLFLVLLVCALFVVLAKPLEVTFDPIPEKISVSGFPPAIRLGERYLGLPGTYSVRAEKKGYKVLEQEVQIAGSGTSTYRFSLEKMPGLVDFLSDPPGVSVFLGSSLLGITPLKDVEIPAGSQKIRFVHERYLPLEKVVQVKGLGAAQSVQATLSPAWAEVRITTDPGGALLLVDRLVEGHTPLALEIEAGPHHLELLKKDFLPIEKEIVVEAGKDISLPVLRLTPAPAMIHLVSSPAGALVAVDNVYKGQAPLTLSLVPNIPHDVTVSLSGHLSQSLKVSYGPEEKDELTVSLEPEYGVVFVSTTPPQAELFIDGKKHGSGTDRLKLTTRSHTIEIRAKGYETVTRSVTPQAGFSQRLEIVLAPEEPAAHDKKTRGAPALIKTAAGQQMVFIKPSPFTMGASSREPGRRANERERAVTLTRSFYLSEKEVTNEEFRRFRPQHSSGNAGKRSLEIDSHPVVNISWDDAARYLNWLSKKDGLAPFYLEKNGKMVQGDSRGTGYRLPTEAEWSYAARKAGRTERARYPWQGVYPPPKVVGNFADESGRYMLPVVIEGYNDSYPATAPAGSFDPNPVGLYDLGGNAAEWCHDYYAAYTGLKKEEVVDPMGPEKGTHHLVRGASWRDAGITELRLSYRRYSREPASDIGFRIARYAE